MSEPPVRGTLLDKLWRAHAVVPETDDTPAVLYVDLHLVHEVTSPQAFETLRERGLRVRRPDRTVATLDHATPTLPPGPDGRPPYVSAAAETMARTLMENCEAAGIRVFGLGDPRRGVVHVIGPELGLTQPGMTIVCGDSHTSTHGAFGALAFGIGGTEVGHVLATQCLLQRKPKAMRIRCEGRLGLGVAAKDLILAIIRRIGFDGGTGHAIEYAGEAIGALSMEGRMTVCNMSIEAGARAGMIAPDEITLAYLHGRPEAPQGAAFEAAATRWLAWRSDADAIFDSEISIEASAVQPMVTYGLHPGMGIGVGEAVPAPQTAEERRMLERMRLTPGRPIAGEKIDVVFLGSCTNGRLSDLEAAAAVLRGRRVREGVRMLVAPGSEAVRREAEAKGLHEIFLAAGAQWRLPGCSMCIAMNGDQAEPGELAVSTSNRNFEGRQGPGSRTVLASPATAAASAVAGVIADPRPYLEAAHAA